MKTIRHREDVPHGAPIFIFGCGKAGQFLAADFARDPGVKVAGFIDNKATGAVGGLPVLSLDVFLRDHGAEGVIVIGSMYVQEISRQIILAGFHRLMNGYPYYLHAMDLRILRRNAAAVGAGALAAAGLLWACFA